MRSIHALIASCALMLLASTAPAQEAVRLKIAAQPLSDALAEFAQQTGLQLIASTDLTRGMTAGVVEGNFTAEEGLKRLLEGAGLRYDFINERTVAIRSAHQSRNGTKPTAEVARETEMRLAQAEGSGSDSSATGGQLPYVNEDSGESSSVRLEEVVVTAQKRIERLQDVPAPVTSIDAESLVNSNQLRIEDYYAKIPGLSLYLTGDAGSPAIAIRGITTGGTTNPGTAVLIDDVPYGGTINGGGVQSVPDIDPGDTARVEVLRGPQGTLYGASTIGGLVKYVTIAPSTEDFSASAHAGLSSVRFGDVGYSLRGSLNLPLSDSTAVRISGFTTLEPGYVDNAQTGEDDVNSRESDGGRLAFLWQPSEDFSVQLGAMLQKSLRGGLSQVNLSLGGFRQSDLPETGVYGRDSEAFTATVRKRWNAIELISVTGYNIDEVETNLDNSSILGPILPLFGICAPPGCAVVQPLSKRFEKFSQEFRAQGSLGESFDWLAGVYYTDEVGPTVYDRFTVDRATNRKISSFLKDTTSATYEEYAAFSSLTVDISDRIDLQVGGRLSRNRQTYTSTRVGPLAAILAGSNPAITPERSSSESVFTYLVTPRLKLSRDAMFYARLASGYRPGGPNAACNLNLTLPCEYSADSTTNYELGFKGNFLDGRLTLDTSAYYIDWKDLQLTRIATQPIALAYLINVGHSQIKGVELSMSIRPWTGMTITPWVARNSAELSEDVPGLGRSGNRLPFSSEWSGSLSIDQEFVLRNGATLFIGATGSFVDDRAGAIADQPFFFPSYVRKDIHAGVELGSWTVNAYANNVSDARGVLGAAFGLPNTFVYIQPRTIGFSVTKTF